MFSTERRSDVFCLACFVLSDTERFFLVLPHKWCLSQPDSHPDPRDSGPVTTFKAIKGRVFHLQRGGKSRCGREGIVSECQPGE